MVSTEFRYLYWELLAQHTTRLKKMQVHTLIALLLQCCHVAG